MHILRVWRCGQHLHPQELREEKVLILPGTVFSLTKIGEDPERQLQIVYREYYEPTDEVEEFILDNLYTKIEEFATD